MHHHLFLAGPEKQSLKMNGDLPSEQHTNKPQFLLASEHYSTTAMAKPTWLN